MRVRFCHFSLLGIDFDELLHQLATGLNLQNCASVADAWQNIFDRISVNGYQEVATVLLLDDVHEAAGEVLTAIARLAQGSGTVNQRFTIIAAADADRSQLIGKRLLELASLRVELWPWSQAETSEFIQRELRRCGRAQGAFDVRALDRIFELTAGNPRQVSSLAELALAAGAGQSMVLVDVETVEAVIDELQITPVT